MVKSKALINDFKNDQSYELFDEQILIIHEVKSEKIKVKVYANQCNSLSLYKDKD